MHTRVKRTTLFAMIALLFVSLCVIALPQQEAHADYYSDRWNECVAKFSWADKDLPKWDGNASGTAMSDLDKDTDGLYKVYNPNQMRWCLVNKQSFRLMNDVDLDGPNRNWTDINLDREVRIDGNGHTIYNLYSYGTGDCKLGLIGQSSNPNTLITNLTISNSRIESSAATSDKNIATFIGGFFGGKVKNCVVKNGLVNGNGSNHVGALFAPDNCTLYPDSDGTAILIENTIAENMHVTGNSCVSGFLEGPWNGNYMTGGVSGNVIVRNCAAINGTVISTGGHSGGFTSCAAFASGYKDLYENCYTNVDVYGNTQTGVFVGVTHGGFHEYNNCYSAGKIEGTDSIGGFFACTQRNWGQETFNNCYSTSMVGMSNGGSNMGGFAGAGNANTYANNCYAAGEVGTLKSAADGTPLDDLGNKITTSNVSGFVGNNIGNYNNCYYDKQTTGMCNIGERGGIEGVLTQQLFRVDLGDAWKSSSGSYPELKVFSDSNADSLSRAYSAASAATVLLWTNDDAYNATKSLDSYDTVRKIRYVFPLTNNENSGKSGFSIKWANYLGEDPEHPLFPNISPLVDGDVPIITLSDAGSKDNVSSVAPGIGWLQVNVTDAATSDTGMRRLRLVPTTAIALASFGNLSLGDLDTVCSNIDADLSSKWEGIDEALFTQKHKPIGEFQDYDHRSNISFVTTSSTAINSFILSGYDNVGDFNSSQTTADKKIIVEEFPKKADGKTFKDGSLVEGDNTTLRYRKGSDDNGDIIDVKLYKQVGGTAENPIWEETPWTEDAIAAFHGGTVVPEMRGTYKLEYEWKDPTAAIVQAQGQKKITISEPAYIVYHLNDGTTLDESAAGTDDYDICAIDPGDYRVGETINSDPAAGHVLHKLDPNYTITGHNEYYWSTTRQAQPVVAQSDEIATQADYVAKEFTEASALHAGRNDVYAAWIPNPHNLVITKTNDDTLDPTDPDNQAATTDKAAYGSKVEDIIEGLSPEGNVTKPDPASELLGWNGLRHS